MRLGFGNCLLDLGTRELFRDQQPVGISPKAFQLLELLVESRPNAISKEKIHESLWPDSYVVDGNLANLVSELREALGDEARSPRLIRTVQRFGYAFVGRTDAAAERGDASGGRPVYRLLWGDREIALRPGENLIGRDEGSVVWIDDVDVSRRHARIVIGDSGARLEDLGSKNGTFLRGERIASEAVLADGNLVRVGGASMIFRSFQRTGPTATAAGSRKGT
jgi:DNA-binding winged helix-turn-helix (wHTH) protein